MHFWLRLAIAALMAALATASSFSGKVVPVVACTTAGVLWTVLAYMRIEDTE